MITPEELAEVSPGVRELVRRLNECGFTTCDSGDGSNFAAGMECADPVAHVHMRIEPREGVPASHDLSGLLTAWLGRDLRDSEVQFTYDPVNEIGLLSILGVRDEDLIR